MDYHIKFPSQTKNVSIIESMIDDLSEKFKLTSEKYGNILISIIEAVNNAIMHGNNMDSSKFVEVSYILEGTLLRFHVADEGKGFDFLHTPDPTTPDNIEKPHGRGIFLMHHLVDELNYYKNGSVLELVFDLKQD